MWNSGMSRDSKAERIKREVETDIFMLMDGEDYINGTK